MPTAEERRDELKRVYLEAAACTRCPVLAQERRAVVFGSGHADADLFLLGEAPGRLDDEQGLPFAGATGRLLSELLEGIGLARADVYVATAIKCRTPGNREPLPAELNQCREWLHRQLELVRPRVVCTLGNFATRLVRDDPAGVTRVHGRPEVRTLGPLTVRVLPLYHPAAALYTRTLLDVLRADVAKLPALLALPAPEQPAHAGLPEPDPRQPAAEPRPPAPEPAGDEDPGGQLGLF